MAMTLIYRFGKLMKEEKQETESITGKLKKEVEDGTQAQSMTSARTSGMVKKKEEEVKERKKFLGVTKKKQEEKVKEWEKYLGVARRPSGRFSSKIRYPASHPRGPRLVWLGYYETPEEAASAYDRRALLVYGSEAKLNFPNPNPNPITTNTEEPVMPHDN